MEAKIAELNGLIKACDEKIERCYVAQANVEDNAFFENNQQPFFQRLRVRSSWKERFEALEQEIRKQEEEKKRAQEALQEEKKRAHDLQMLQLKNQEIQLQLQLQLQLPSSRGGFNRPPRSPGPSRRPPEMPTSTGKEKPDTITSPKKAPSTEDGKKEGLEHAADKSNTTMQCTSHPTCVELMELLEKTITERKEPKDSKPDKFATAASKVVLANSYSARYSTIVSSNERFFTGALANAMNAVFDDGFTALHQGCLGTGATHSDLSVCRFKPEPDWPITLLVGEGKRSTASQPLRDATRGQLFNELLRHRSIEFKMNEASLGYFGPILLVAFDTNYMEIDLAFPSKKGSQLERDGAISFNSKVNEGTEVFWTVRLLCVSIQDETNLALVLQFLSSALKKLDQWQAEQLPRVHFKIPTPLSIADKIEGAKYYNENVSVLTVVKNTNKRAVLVFKEYCYNLRQEHSILIPTIYMSERDQRKPPPVELLECLGPPYSTKWKIHDKQSCGSVLEYEFIEGSSSKPTASGWIQILQQISKMHKAGYVHGDLLPRNVLFNGESNGYVIDFDLSREEHELYVKGFNWSDFQEFRHADALPLEPMEKIHDIHSLCQISCHYFYLSNYSIEQSNIDLEGLISYFDGNKEQLEVKDFHPDDDSALGGKHTSGSSNR